MAYEKTEAIVLRGHELRESSRLVILFTRRLGRIAATARGVRKVGSRFGGALEPFTYVEVQLYRSWKTQRLTITGCEVIDPFPGLRANLKRVGWASLGAELVLRLTLEEDPQPALFNCLLRFVHQLNDAEDPEDIALRRLIEMITILGYGLDLETCARCGSALEGAESALYLGGRLVCPSCARPHEIGHRLRQNSIAALKNRTTIPPEDRKEILKIIVDHLSYHAEVRLNAARFLESLPDE